MPTKRRSVSIKGNIYERLKHYAESVNDSCSSLVESMISEKLDALGVRTFTEEEAEALRPKNGGTRLDRPEKRTVRLAVEEDAIEEGRGSGIHLF